ncbi:kelch repeat protein [Ostertagia ostertagi]
MDLCCTYDLMSSQLSVSVLNGCLYAIGGLDEELIQYTVERLDPRVGKWEFVCQLPIHRSHLGSAVLNGYLYAVGGQNSQKQPMGSVEKYDPRTNEWIAVVELKSKRSGVRTAVVNEKLYAVGGFDGVTHLATVEVFDTEGKSVDNSQLHEQWTIWGRCRCSPNAVADFAVAILLQSRDSAFSLPHYPPNLAYCKLTHCES